MFLAFAVGDTSEHAGSDGLMAASPVKTLSPFWPRSPNPDLCRLAPAIELE